MFYSRSMARETISFLDLHAFSFCYNQTDHNIFINSIIFWHLFFEIYEKERTPIFARIFTILFIQVLINKQACIALRLCIFLRVQDHNTSVITKTHVLMVGWEPSKQHTTSFWCCNNVVGTSKTLLKRRNSVVCLLVKVLKPQAFRQPWFFSFFQFPVHSVLISVFPLYFFFLSESINFVFNT